MDNPGLENFSSEIGLSKATTWLELVSQVQELLPLTTFWYAFGDQLDGKIDPGYSSSELQHLYRSQLLEIRDRYQSQSLHSVSFGTIAEEASGIWRISINRGEQTPFFGLIISFDKNGFFFLLTEQSMENVRKVSNKLLSLLGHFHMRFEGRVKPKELPPLSDRHKELLALLNKGFQHDRIAYEMGLTVRGVNYHLDKLRDFLGAKGRKDILLAAYRRGYNV